MTLERTAGYCVVSHQNESENLRRMRFKWCDGLKCILRERKWESFHYHVGRLLLYNLKFPIGLDSLCLAIGGLCYLFVSIVVHS